MTFEPAGSPVGSELWYYTYPKHLDDGRIAPCMVEVFALRVEKMAGNFPELGQRQRQRVSFTQAQNLVDEPELRTLMPRLDAELRKRAQLRSS